MVKESFHDSGRIEILTTEITVDTDPTVKMMKELLEGGVTDWLENCMKNQTDVYIKRSNGSWQTGKIVAIQHYGLSVQVSFVDPTSGKTMYKDLYGPDMSGKTLLDWQIEAQKD